MSDDGGLGERIQHAVDGLLAALVPEPLGEDRFRLQSEPGRFGRVFGGQLVAQALLGAALTVDGRSPQSLHAYFVQGGEVDAPVEVAVERVRDGRSMATRRATLTQGDRTLLVALASFHDNPDAPELPMPPPSVPGPDEVPSLQDWAHRLPPELEAQGTSWIHRPPPLDVRIDEPPNFLNGPSADGTRSHWMRVPRDVGRDPLLHAVLLAYASDYFLLDMVFRSHPQGFAPGTAAATSVDHAIWFHRPVRFDRWHLHTMETLALSGHRGLARGSLHDDDGHLVASTAQEVLVRPVR